MKIGLDVSVIQTPHRMRGIGATALNFINSMPADIKSEHSFVLFLHEEGQEEALSLLSLEGMDYEVRHLKHHRHAQLNLPGKLRIINSILNVLIKKQESKKGDPRIGNIKDLDAYLEFDQMQALPKANGKTKLGIIVYDLIPYVMEADYLWDYRTARDRGCSRKGALRKSLLRRRYVDQLRIAGRRADKLFAISDHTKHDFVQYTGTEPAKVQVTPLGVDQSLPDKTPEHVEFSRYVANSWGEFPQRTNLEDKPFLLFLGGADPRRKLIDLFAAYNNLKAQGRDLRLVLAGDTMKGFASLPGADLQKYVKHESYKDDVYFLGFVTDEQREWLYDHALAMVYPSVYEGFGLPVLEAMRYGTPVVTYNNSSIKEIAGEAALYARDSVTIKAAVEELLSDPALRVRYAAAGQQQAALFPWSSTVTAIVRDLAA